MKPAASIGILLCLSIFTLFSLSLQGQCPLDDLQGQVLYSSPSGVWGPFTTNTSTKSAEIRWYNGNSSHARLEYASDDYYKEYATYRYAIDINSKDANGHCTLTGLTPDKFYHYRLILSGNITKDRIFRTFPEGGSFTFIVYSDSQEPQGDPYVNQLTRHAIVTKHIARENDAYFVLHTGDLVTDPGDSGEWDRFFIAADPVLAETSFFTVAGNHEYRGTDAIEHYKEFFGLPLWYSFDCGDVHLTVLDSNEQSDPLVQADWLMEDLKRLKQFLFVAFHHPQFSSSERNYGGWKHLEALWGPTFRDRGVDAVFNGHVHAYERLESKGIQYIVAGTGGGPFYSLRTPRIEESRASRESTLGYVRVSVDPELERLTLEYVCVADMLGDVLLEYPRGIVMDRVVTGPDTSPLHSPLTVQFTDTSLRGDA
jgi:predicted phosphodiesterase